MDKPSWLAFSDYATFRFFRAEILLFIGMIFGVLIIARVTGDDPLAPLTLSEMVMSALCLAWIGIFGVGAWGYRLWEKIQIRRMFAGEIWECWQLSTPEWESEVESVCSLISPDYEGMEAYQGAIYSSIIGAVVALIMIIVGILVVKDPFLKKSFWFGSGIVFLLFVGAGLIQPLSEKYKADRYRRKALRVKSPRVWFGPEGIYHETLGHTSLKELHQVRDQTKSRKRIQFTLEVSSGDSNDLVRVPTPVPVGCEERASQLVRRFRQHHIEKEES